MAVAIPIIAAVLSAAGGAYAASEQQRSAEIQQNEAIEQQRAAETRAIQAQQEAQTRAQEAAIKAQKEAEARQKAYNEEVAAANQKAYQENAYPTEAEIEAERASGLKTLGNDRVSRLNQLARASATRGLGSGSGAIAQGGGAIESAYLEGLSGLSSNLSKLANTPKSGFTFPYMANVGASSGYTTGTSGITGARSGYSATNTQGSTTSPLGTALGYMMGSGGSLGSLFGNNNAANTNLSSSQMTTTPDYYYQSVYG